jgi:hypothetical protein
MRLRVRVHPGARRESIQGWRADGSLKLSVAARPEGGLANQAVTALLAEALGVPRARVSLVQGRGGRSKVLEIEGLSDEQVRQRIEEALVKENGDDGQ